MTRTAITLQAADGPCNASIFRPSGTGPWPAVLFLMDGVGYREALFTMAERIAAHGYFVLLPDLFYRAGPYTAPDPGKLFSDPEMRAAWFGKYIAMASQANVRRDCESFFAYLDAQPDVTHPHVGTTGYCMGGSLSLAMAGHFPERVVAAAAYHPGRIATDQPESPHLLAPKIKARVHVARASDDPSFPDDMKARLDEALTAANVEHTIETSPARHGWTVPDTPVFDAREAERHYQTLFALLDAKLR